MNPEDPLKSLSLDYLNLLINGQAFSDVTFTVEGRQVHAHKCILAARSPFFRMIFCNNELMNEQGGRTDSTTTPAPNQVIPVGVVGYEVFLLVLQFLYSGQVSIIPQKHEARPNCSERGCWHTHCTSAIDLALDTLTAAHFFGVDQLAIITQKQLAIMVEKASIEDVMRVLLAARKQDLQHLYLWNTCSHLVAKSGLPSEVLSKHLPADVIAKIEEIRLKYSTSYGRPFLHVLPNNEVSSSNSMEMEMEDQRMRRMQRALDSSDVELVRLMVMGEGLNLDKALALHYAVANCSREVVKTLLELGAADVNHPGPGGRMALHIAAEMVNPDMVAVLLDHHANPNVRTCNGATPFDILQSLASDFLSKGGGGGGSMHLPHLEHNKLRLCLELLQSAALVLSRDEETSTSLQLHLETTTASADHNTTSSSSSPAFSLAPRNDMMQPRQGHSEMSEGSSSQLAVAGLDSRMLFLNLSGQIASKDGTDDMNPTESP